EQPLGAPEVERVAALALERDAHVLEHREVREDRRDLEGAHQAHARDRRGPRAGDLTSLVEDLAARRRQELREQIKAGGLAGAIRANERVDAAAPHFQRDVIDGDEALEFLREPARLENDVVRQAASSLRGAMIHGFSAWAASSSRGMRPCRRGLLDARSSLK